MLDINETKVLCLFGQIRIAGLTRLVKRTTEMVLVIMIALSCSWVCPDLVNCKGITIV